MKQSKLLMMSVALLFLTACQTTSPVVLDGPGPEKTFGYLVDYGPCKVGADLNSPGERGVHIVVNGKAVHSGIDFHSDLFVPIVAAAPGRIIDIVRDDESKRSMENAGALVVLSHGSFKTGYLHLERIPEDIRLGDYVRRGQVIGHNGLTGITRAPHVHFYVRPTRGNLNTLNAHAMWAVPAEQVQNMRITVPFFEEDVEYPDDNKLTAPMLRKDCGLEWKTRHPTKPWRGV